MPHHTWSVQINSRKRVPMQQESNSINSINRSNQPHPKHIKTSKTHTQLLPHHVHGQNNTAHVTFLFAVHFQQPLLAINQPRRSSTGGLAPSSFVALVGEFRNGRRRGLYPPAHARKKITDPHHGFHGHPDNAFADAFDKALHPLFLCPFHRLREHPGQPGHNAFPQTFGPVPGRIQKTKHKAEPSVSSCHRVMSEIKRNKCKCKYATIQMNMFFFPYGLVTRKVH